MMLVGVHLAILAAQAGRAVAAKSVVAEEIIVTGERAPRSLRDTPSSVSVFRAPDIEAVAAAERLDQLLAVVPNVQLGSRSDAPSIRGQDATGVLRDLPAFLGGARPRATLQVDGRAVTYNEFAYGIAALWDVARVEVFRSPQTTTQGQNAIGGAIFVETEDPGHQAEGRVRGIVGNGQTEQLSAVASAPLVGDQLAFRVSGDFRRSRTSSRLRGNISGVDLNKDAYVSVRAKLLLTPNLLPNMRVLLTYAHVNSAMPQMEGVRPPFRKRRDNDVTYGYFRTDVDSLTARADYQITPRLSSRSIVSWGDAFVRRFAPPGFGDTRIVGRDQSAETVLQWRANDALEMVGGVHHLSTKLKQRIDLTGAFLGVGRFSDQQTSTGIFGEIRWRAMPPFELLGGLRYQDDDQRRAGTLMRPTQPISLNYNGHFRALLPKVSASYEFSDQVRAGVLVQRAYNPGGVTLDLRTRTADQFQPEWLWDYELFTRAKLLHGDLSLRGNLFRYEMRNAQRQQLVQLVTPGGVVSFSELANAPRARSSGAEIELSYRATSRLSLKGGLGLLGTKITKTRADADPLLGKPFARAPKITASGAIDWRPLSHLRLSAQVRHHSRYNSDDAGTKSLAIGSGTIADARGEWTQGRFAGFVYARNLFDSFQLTYRFRPQPLALPLATAEDPREIGFGLTINL